MFFFFFPKLKVAEAYIKLDSNFDRDSIAKIDSTLRKIAFENSNRLKNVEDVSILIEYEEGSLKARVFIYGILVIQGIAQYGEIREGLDFLYKDAKWLSNQIIKNSRSENNFIDENFLRAESRTGVTGRLKRTLDRIEYLQENLNSLGNNQVQQELNELHSDLASLIVLLSLEQRQIFLKALPDDIRKNLPDEDPSKTKHFYNLYAMKPEDDTDLEQELE